MGNEWRITKITIEAEMLRLAALLSGPSCSGRAPSGLLGRELRATTASLASAVRSVSQPSRRRMDLNCRVSARRW